MDVGAYAKLLYSNHSFSPEPPTRPNIEPCGFKTLYIHPLVSHGHHPYQTNTLRLISKTRDLGEIQAMVSHFLATLSSEQGPAHGSAVSKTLLPYRGATFQLSLVSLCLLTAIFGQKDAGWALDDSRGMKSSCRYQNTHIYIHKTQPSRIHCVCPPQHITGTNGPLS